jgi:threonine 3-dehydrogenase
MSTAVPATMRVPRFGGEGTLRWEERDVPTPRANEVLLAVKANALCGSERGQWERGADVTPGHEVVGEVVATGPASRHTVGTFGVVYLMIYCGECRSCHIGYTNQCLRKAGDIGFNRDGGYGPYIAVPDHVFHPVDIPVPAAEATLLLDIMGTGGHAIKRASLVHPDPQSLLVMGAGPMGLGVLVMTKILYGAEYPVVIGDVVPYRLELAERLGGLPIDLSQTSLPAGIHAHGMAKTDLAIDTSGRTLARRAAFDALDQRGVLVCVGHGGELSLTVSPDLIANERAVLGSEYFRWDEIASNIPLLRQHHDYLQQIITHTFGVDELAHAFELFLQGNTGKVVIVQ